MYTALGCLGLTAGLYCLLLLAERRGSKGLVRGLNVALVAAVLVSIVAVAAPKLERDRMEENETAAIVRISDLHRLQSDHLGAEGAYATSPERLGLGLGEHDGYRFRFVAVPGGYVVEASPIELGGSGRRSFYSDQTGVIREHWGQGIAGPESPALR